MPPAAHQLLLRTAVATTLSAGVLLSGSAAAQGTGGTPTLEIAYAIEDDHLHVGFDVSSYLDARWLDRVDSGLTATLVVAVAVLPFGDPAGAPVGVSARRCEIVYDLWAERYTVTVRDPEQRHRFLAGDRETAVSHCARPASHRLVGIDALDLRRRYVVEIAVDTDPDRPQMRARTREYLGEPGGRGDGTGGPSLFGTVVRALFREGGDDAAEAVVRLRGIPFGEPLLTQALAAAESRRASEEGEEE
jgi:hypothetical protein